MICTQRAFSISGLRALLRGLEIRLIDLLGDLFRCEVHDDDAVGRSGLPVVVIEIEVDALGVFLRVAHFSAAARGREVQEKRVLRRPTVVQTGVDGVDFVIGVIVVAILHAQRLAVVDHGVRGGVRQNGAVALIRPAEVQAAALEADRKLVVKPRGEDDLPAHFAQRRDFVFQIPALRILVDRLIQDLLNLRDIVLAVFRLHAQDYRLGGVGVQKRGNVAQHVIECERSGKRGVGGLAARDAVLEHQRLLVVLLFEHQTHIQIAVAVDQLRGNARVLTLKNVAHIHILRAAVVRTGDRHIAELCLVRHGFHPVGAGDVRCHGRRRGDPGKDGKHHADEQRAEPEAVFGGLHKVFSSSFLCRTSIPCGGRVPPV